MKFLPQKYGITWFFILTGAMALWATQYPINKLLSSLDPFLYSTLRFLFATIALTPFIWRKKQKHPPIKNHLFLFIVTGSIMGAISALIFKGISLSNTIVASIIVNSNPIWIAFLAPLITHEKFPTKKLIPIIIGVIGITISSLNGQSLSTVFASSEFSGLMLLMTAAILIAIYTIASKKLVAHYGATTTNFTLTTIATIVFIPVIIWNHSLLSVLNFSTQTWFFVISMGALATAVPYTLWKASMDHLSSTVAGSFKLLIPVFATIYALLFLNEPLTLSITTGILLTSFAIYQIQKPT